jgi:microcystin degradation protein MlrC
MRQFIQAMTEVEQQDGVLSVSFAHGFPFGDVPDAGGKILVVTDNNPSLAKELAQSLGQQIFALRHQINFPCLPLYKALSKAQTLAEKNLATENHKPIVIADQSDNAGGGAPGDATYALAWLLEHQLQNVGMAIFYDPQVVKLSIAAGVGAQLNIRLGGKLGPTSGDPLDIAVTVIGIQRNYQHRFPQIDLKTGKESEPVYWPIGDTVALHCQAIDLIVSSERAQCFSPCIFTDLGINPNEKSLLVIKSAQHFYGAFAPMASEVIYMAAPGAVPPIMQQIPYQRMRTDNKFPWVEDPFSMTSTNDIQAGKNL